MVVKIQHGGPLGLQRLLGVAGVDRVEDVDALAAAAGINGGAVPAEGVAPDMTADGPRARRGR